MNSSETKPIKIALNIGDQLTSISCGNVVVEMIKFLAFQRLQIPYSYQWLKQVVNKRKSWEDQNIMDSLQSERHFRIASTSLENLDFIIKSLLQEITGCSVPEEVCIALGGSSLSFKEVYRLLLPRACHKPQCHSDHIAADQKIQRSVFKALVTSEELNKVIFNPLAPTNMYVYIKKNLVSNHNNVPSYDTFHTTTGCKFPKTTKVIVIDFKTDDTKYLSCCNEFRVFGETVDETIPPKMADSCESDDEFYVIESSDTMKWFQSAYTMKGFKDCFVDGKSVTNTWLGLDS